MKHSADVSHPRRAGVVPFTLRTIVDGGADRDDTLCAYQYAIDN
jgi:hypothetical protein